MVDYQDIKEIINKCMKISDMQYNLNDLSDDEKLNLLEDKLNPFEQKAYLELRELMKHWELFSSDAYADTPEKKKKYTENYEDYKNKVFQYERRIYDGYQKPVHKDIPQVNLEDYVEEDEFEGIHDEHIKKYERSAMNRTDKIRFEKFERDGLRHYFSGEYIYINGELHNGNRWKELTATEKQAQHETNIETIRGVDSAIKKSKGLTKPTIVYHGDRHFDPTLTIGDKYKVDGYLSTSYNKQIGEYYARPLSDGQGNLGVVIRYLVRKKIPCLSANGTGLTKHNSEHELLFGRGSEGTIIDIDYDAESDIVHPPIVTVLLDE